MGPDTALSVVFYLMDGDTGTGMLASESAPDIQPLSESQRADADARLLLTRAGSSERLRTIVRSFVVNVTGLAGLS